jgi:DNA-binding response OmpR family regulator
MRILLVDDEAELVSTLAERLSFRGIEADWVTTGEEALKQVEEQRYAVAVLDVKIPRISGLALKKLLEEKDPRLKFIFLTGHGSEEDFMLGSAEAGAAYYLIKPVDLNLLIDKLNEITKRNSL